MTYALLNIFEKEDLNALIIAVVAILVAAAILGTIKWTRERILSFVRRLIRRGWYEIKRPFAWGRAILQECRRLYSYFGRDITWDDLPQNSKDNVKFHDLSESARLQLRLIDLSNAVRRKMRLSDLPQDEKNRILSKIFLPDIYDSQYHATLAQFDNVNSTPRIREVELVVQKADDFHTEIWQDGMELRLTINFQNSEYEIPFDEDKVIHFDASKSGIRWYFPCNPKHSWKDPSGSHKVTVRIYYLRFNGLIFYQ